MCIGFGFIFRWVLRDVIALDQLLGLSVGIIILLTMIFVKRYSKESCNS